MTDSQVKYQQVMENQRHNLEMERLGQAEVDVKASRAEYQNRADAWTAADKAQQMEQRPWQVAGEFVRNIVGSIVGGAKALFA